jgi:hypothetical protein
MTATPLRAVCLGGFLYGSIVYGLVLSLIHVFHNRLGSTRDALVTWVVFNLLYGLAAAAVFVVGYVLGRLRGREAVERGAWLGLFLFNLGFWELFWLYGLTYDQYPFGRLSEAGGMAAFVAVLVVIIALAVALVSWLLFRLLRGLWRGGWLSKVAVAGYVLGLIVHAAAPLYAGRPWGEEPAQVEQPTPRIPVEETGVKVALVGLDGTDWQVLQPMIDQGELPAFAAMAKKGTSGSLATFPDSGEEVVGT